MSWLDVSFLMLWISGLIFFVASLYSSMTDFVKEKPLTVMKTSMIIVRRIFALSSFISVVSIHQ